MQAAGGRVHGRIPELLGVHFAEAFVALNGDPRFSLPAQLLQLGRKLILRPQIMLPPPGLHLEQGRQRHIYIAAFEEGAQVAVQKREEQGANMRPVHVRIRHQDNLVVPQTRQVERIFQAHQPRAQGRHHIPNLLVFENPGQAGPLHVQNLPAQGQDGLKMAVARLLGRSPRRVPLDQVEFRFLRLARGAVRQFARQAAAGKSALALHQFARLAGGKAGLRGQNHLLDDRFRLAGMVFEPLPEFFVHQRFDRALHLRIPQFGLGLPLELRLGHPDGKHGGQSFPEIVPGQVHLGVLHQIVLFRIGFEGPGQRPPESRYVRASFVRIDVVDERQHVLRVTGVVSHRQFHRHLCVFLGNVDRFLLNGRPGFVQVVNEFHNAPLEMVFLAAQRFFFLAEVLDSDADVAVEIGQFAQTAGEGIEPEFRFAEYVRVRAERNFGSGFFVRAQGASPDDRPQRLAVRILLAPFVAVPPHRGRQRHGQGVHAGDAYPVQPAGHLVRILVELAARMQRRHHHFQGGTLLLGVFLHRNAAPVVHDAHRAVFVDGRLDPVAVPGQRLVDRIVHDFVHQVVEPAEAYVPYVHGRALADGFQPFKHLNVFGAVPVFGDVYLLIHCLIGMHKSVRTS